MSNLQELTQHWYQILKDQGFHDIEFSEEYLKDYHSFSFFDPIRVSKIRSAQNYYSFASDFLHGYSFQTLLEKQIWECHCEGQSIRETAEFLKIKAHQVFKILKKLKPLLFSKKWIQEEK